MRGGGPDRRRAPSPMRGGARGGARGGGDDYSRDYSGGAGAGFPPPPGGYRGGRRRSPSPMDDYSRGGGGRGGGYRGDRSPKRFRPEDDYNHFGPPQNGPRHGNGPPPYDRRGLGGGGSGGPPPFRDRYHDGPHRDGPYRDAPYRDAPPRDGQRRPYRDGPPSPLPQPQRRGPLAYKEFMNELPDDITPEEAQKEFQAYLIRWWGSQVKAEFEARKEDPAVRRQHDPREHQKAVVHRNKVAATTASQLWEDVKNGKVDPTTADFNQGNGQSAPAAVALEEDDEPVWDQAAPAQSPPVNAAPSPSAAGQPASPTAGNKVAPEVSWQPARLATDRGLARELATKLDTEKGISDNPLLSDSKADAKGPGASPAAAEGAVLMDTDVAASSANQNDPMKLAGTVDILLTYLWRVHGCDYYSGHEILEPEDSQRSAPRPTLRCPRPEEGEQPDEALYAQQEAILNKGVDSVWRARLQKDDPFSEPLHSSATAAHMAAWTDAQILKIDDKKWGSKVSQKLFVDREYVLKHIRNKHGNLVAAEKDRFMEELYFENFKASREKEQRVAREAAAKSRQAELAEQGLPPGEWGSGKDGATNGGDFSGPMGAPPFPGVAGLMDVPAGCVLVPAPGAGPLGPFIPVPIDEAPAGMAMMGGGPRPGRGMRPPGMPMNNLGGGGGRGRRGPMSGPLAMAAGRGPGMGGMGTGNFGVGRGGGPMGGGMMGGMGLVAPTRREYLDLDDPGNNRKVLDYSDL